MSAAGVEELVRRLQHALVVFRDHDMDEDATPNAQTGMIASLAALMDFAAENGVDRALLRPVRELLGAIEDLDRGSPNVLLLKRARKGKPPLNLEREALLGAVSVAITLLHERGNLTIEQAARRAAGKLNAAGIVFRGGAKIADPDWEYLQEVREKVIGCRAHPAALEDYTFYLRFMRDRGFIPGVPAMQIIDAFLDQLAGSLARETALNGD